jgi:hypothetical protein
VSSTTHIKTLLQKALLFMNNRDYAVAEEVLTTLLAENPQDAEALAALARCRLALGKTEDAKTIYQKLLSQSEFTALQGEAALVLQQPHRAAVLFSAALQQQPNNGALRLLAAVTDYLRGHIKHGQAHLVEAVRLGFEWEDDDPLDFVIQAVLRMREFHDFEELYLDAIESSEGEPSPQNRWFFLNMPVYDWLAATGEHRQKRAAELAELLSPSFDSVFLNNGRNELLQIVEDLAKNPENAELSVTLKKLLHEGNFQQTARLILALVLEHLAQFASFFGLAAEEVVEVELQKLLPLLPSRIAVSDCRLDYSVVFGESTAGYSHRSCKKRRGGFAAAGIDCRRFYCILSAGGYLPHRPNERMKSRHLS